MRGTHLTEELRKYVDCEVATAQQCSSIPIRLYSVLFYSFLHVYSDSGIDESKEEEQEAEEDPLVFERQLDEVFNVMASGKNCVSVLCSS